MGWTQAQLAQQAGYTTKHISDAERGIPISVFAIEVIAETISAKRPVDPEELIFDPLDLSKRFIAAYNDHKSELVREIQYFLHEEVVFEFAGDPAVIPIAGRHVGIAAADTLFKTFFSVFVTPEDKPLEPTYVTQENIVSMWGVDWSHPPGVESKPIWLAIRFTYENGKLRHFEDFFDTHLGTEQMAKSRALKGLEGQ